VANGTPQTVQLNNHRRAVFKAWKITHFLLVNLWDLIHSKPAA